MSFTAGRAPTSATTSSAISGVADTSTVGAASSLDPPVPTSLSVVMRIVCRAIAPASTTATPPTTRADVPLSSCSRRIASCQDDGPPRSRPATRSTSHGSSTGTPTSSSATPADTAIPQLLEPFGSPAWVTSNAIPAAISTSRHHSRRRIGLA